MIDYGYGIKLDHCSQNDRDQFFHWRNHSSIWKWCRQNGPITYNQHLAYWHSVDQCSDKKFMAIVAVEGNLGVSETKAWTVGCAGLTSIDYVNSRAEFSLYIGPEHQRRGYGKRALQTLFTYGFNYLNLNCIWGETFDGNPALQTFLEIGMTKEGTRRGFYFRDGKYTDAHLVSVMRDEWDTSKSHSVLRV